MSWHEGHGAGGSGTVALSWLSCSEPLALVGWGNRGTAESSRAGRGEWSQSCRLIPGKEQPAWPHLDLTGIRSPSGLTMAAGPGGGQGHGTGHRSGDPGPSRGARPWHPVGARSAPGQVTVPAAACPRLGGASPEPPSPGVDGAPVPTRPDRSRRRLGQPMPRHGLDPACVGRGHHACSPPPQWHGAGCPDVRPMASPPCSLGLPSCCACLGFLQPPGTPAPPHAATRAPRQRAPHRTRHRTAPGVGCHAPAEVCGERKALGKDTHVAPGAATHVGTGACRVLPAVPRQVPSHLATLPRHGPGQPAQPGVCRRG